MLLLTMLIILFSSCSSQTKKEEKILRVNFLQGDPCSSHPQYIVDTKSNTLVNCLFEGLTRINTQRQAELAIAKSYQVSQDGKTYVFTLKNTTWSNGAPLTAYHFEKAWKRVVQPQTKATCVKRFNLIKNAEKVYRGEMPLDALGVRCIDPYTLMVELENPAPYFLEVLALPFFAPLFEDNSNEPTIFNGPFILKSWKSNHKISLRKNSKYWDRCIPLIDGIDIFVVQDESVAFSMYESGQLDLIGDTISSLNSQTLKNPKVRPHIIKNEANHMFWIICNVNDPNLCSKKIRKALSSAIDRNSICRSIAPGKVFSEHILPKSLSYIDKQECFSEKTKEEILEMFNEGLQDLSMKKEEFSLTLSYRAHPIEEIVAEFTQNSWKKTFSIKVILEKLDWHYLIEKAMNKKYQLICFPIASLFNDQMSLIENFKDRALNFCGWENPEFKKWFLAAVREKDFKKRKNFLSKCEKVLQHELPVIPIYQQSDQFLLKEYVKGYFITLSGMPEFRWVHFTN